MTPAERLDLYLREGRIIRHAWTGRDEHGRKTACLLAALAGDIGSPEECPASVLWPWLAHMVPDFDDLGSKAAWPAMVRRFAAVMRRYSVIAADRAAERRVLARTMIAAMEIAAPHDRGSSCADVAALWRRSLAGCGGGMGGAGGCEGGGSGGCARGGGGGDGSEGGGEGGNGGGNGGVEHHH